MIVSIGIQKFASDCRWNKSCDTCKRVCNTHCMCNIRRADIVEICFWCWKLKSHKCLKTRFQSIICNLEKAEFYLCDNSECDNCNNITANGKVEEAKSSRENWATAVQTSANIFPAIASTFNGIISSFRLSSHRLWLIGYLSQTTLVCLKSGLLKIGNFKNFCHFLKHAVS